MQRNVLIKQPHQYGFKEVKKRKNDPFIAKWNVWKQFDENFSILYKQENNGIVFAPLYVSSFQFPIPWNGANVRKFKEKYPNSELIQHTASKIRYYRFQKKLKQKDLAEYVGITRSAMVYYEDETRDFYEIDVLRQFAELLEVEIEDLLDDYNYFLYKGQAVSLKEFRKENHLTQRRLAELLNVDITKIKGWERSKVRMSKASYNKFITLAKSFDK